VAILSNLLVALTPTADAWIGLVALGAADMRRAGMFVICLILAIAVHEFSHAWMATKLGDSTPEGQGRLTLNPIAHADPIGTLVLPLVLSFSGNLLFGWGRPVETQPRNYTRKITMRGGMALVSFAGPASNLLLAVLTLGLVFGLAQAGVIADNPTLFEILRVFFNLNLLLFVFNLIPIHPLDGGKMLAWLMGPKYQHVDDFLSRYGFIILMVLIFMPPYLLTYILGPFFTWGNMALAAVI
jgi:Zn-dependent protease